MSLCTVRLNVTAVRNAPSLLSVKHWYYSRHMRGDSRVQVTLREAYNIYTLILDAGGLPYLRKNPSIVAFFHSSCDTSRIRTEVDESDKMEKS